MVVLTEISQQSSSSSSAYVYDVFLSFRGTDTRNSFTDHLYKALQEANIKTFLDDAEIETGEELKPELQRAIRASRASIIVLSKNYASSTWCLEELVLILEQRRTSEHIVIPIFYNIEPTHVRKQQSSFGDAMEKHKEKMEKRSHLAEKMEQWKKALTEVANIKGKEAKGRRETMLIEEVIEEINTRLDLHKLGDLPKIFGRYSSIDTITSFLTNGSSQVLTIWGMAGIGKTYLAEYIFQSHFHDFERSCFLQDIERRWELSDGLLDLQKQLLKDIRIKTGKDIRNTNAGTLEIVESLLRKRTLLVLDDVSKKEQLDAFIGTKGIHPGSKIVLTTKNGSLTENWLTENWLTTKNGWLTENLLFQTHAPLNHTKQELEGLNENESLELLCFHAFGRIEPKKCQKQELIKVVQYCQGHPLALKILGSSIRNEDATWDDIIESLGKEINFNIRKVLQISIDSLPRKEDKDVFKHIACFFIWKNRYFTEEVLKACGICNSSTIKNLSNRCLVNVRYDNLNMHQLLQDTGREMIYQESPKPWKCSLLWNHEDCFNVLQKEKGTSKIRGLVLDMEKDEARISCGSRTSYKRKRNSDSPAKDLCSSFQHQKSSFQTHALGKMCNLKILLINYVQLYGSYKNFPEGLRWLCMHGFRLSYIPLDLAMENMVALDMSYSNLKQLWKKPKLLKLLKFLNMSCCRELVSVDHFSGFPALERLTLSGCTSLVEVCESIGDYCKRLEVLDLNKCSKLKKLPRSIGRLKKLRILSIDGCSNVGEFPSEMKDKESLEVLEANNINKESQVSCSVMESIPRSSKSFFISLPSSLVSLSLKNNNLSNKSFPVNFSSLSMLKWLYLDENPIDSLPDFVRSLSRLECLVLNNCPRLRSILGVSSTIRRLYTEDCNALERITFSQETSTTPAIYFNVSESLREIEGQFKVEGIEEVEEEILDSLGWSSKIKKDVKDFQHMLTYYYDCNILYRERHGAQMIYEKGVFITYFESKEIPEWIIHRSKGRSISITIPSCPNTCRIRGLNLCFLMEARLGIRSYDCPWFKIGNLTKKCFWKYFPLYINVKRKDGGGGGGIVWLCHSIFYNNDFEEGDEIIVEGGGYGSEEIGMSIVYDDGNKKHNPLYFSYNPIKSQDLSLFY